MTPGVGLALRVELRKAAHASAVRGSVVALVGGTAVLCLAFALALGSGDARMAAKLGAAGAAPGWAGLIATAEQVAAAGSILAVGVVAAWLVGREFADRTIGGLFAVAVGRGSIAAAKLAVVVLVAGLCAVLTTLAVVMTGALLGYGVPSAADAAALGRLLVLVAWAGPLALPCAWAATAGRGLLAGVGTAVALLASTQVAVVAGGAAWFPLAVPALWALDPGSAAPAAFAGSGVVGVAAALLVVRAWQRLQLDR
jgi:ABC-2 type transport system permease protein